MQNLYYSVAFLHENLHKSNVIKILNWLKHGSAYKYWIFMTFIHLQVTHTIFLLIIAQDRGIV